MMEMAAQRELDYKPCCYGSCDYFVCQGYRTKLKKLRDGDTYTEDISDILWRYSCVTV